MDPTDELPMAEGVLVNPHPPAFSTTDVQLVLELFKIPLDPGAGAIRQLELYQDKARIVALYRHKFEDPLEQRIVELEAKLANAGICPDCGQEIVHSMDEPYASCPCGKSDGEWTIVPTISGLRYEVYNLTYCNPHLNKITGHLFKGKMTAICTDPAICTDQVIGEFDKLNAALLELANKQ